MKKKDILKKIEEQVARGILKPSGDPVGLKITKQALKKSKEENDSYYKELEKKFKDYLKLDVKDNPSPKVNMTDEERKMYYGTGMEGLKYDDEGTPKYEKFVKRNEELNKPSKNYYLNKDQVEDSYDKIMKDGKAYKKHKYEKPDEYQKTPKVRITKESEDKKTMKQLSYKKPFVSYEKTVTLIPENYKTDGNKFRMTDGNEYYTIRWEGDSKNGSPVLLTYKNETLVKEDVSKMKHLYDYKSEETLMKTNDALTENQIFMELMGKSRTLVTEQNPPMTGTKPTTTGVKSEPPKAEQPQTIAFTGKVGDESKEVSFYVTFLRKDNKLEITKTELVIDGKRIDNPTPGSVAAFTKNYDIFPSNKTTPKYESVYTIVQRAMKNGDISKSLDNKKLMANANAAALALPHKYSESYSVKPQTIQDVNIQFYPHKIVDQSTGAKESCKLPNYYVISSKGKVSGMIKLGNSTEALNALKTVGKEFEDTKFGGYAMSDKVGDLLKQIKQMGVASCGIS